MFHGRNHVELPFVCNESCRQVAHGVSQICLWLYLQTAILSFKLPPKSPGPESYVVAQSLVSLAWADFAHATTVCVPPFAAVRAVFSIGMSGLTPDVCGPTRQGSHCGTKLPSAELAAVTGSLRLRCEGGPSPPMFPSVRRHALPLTPAVLAQLHCRRERFPVLQVQVSFPRRHAEQSKRGLR